MPRMGNRRGTERAARLTSELLATIRQRELRVDEMVFPTAARGAWLPWAY